MVFWNRAAHQGYVAAYVKCGDYYYQGHHGLIDFKACIEFYAAAEQSGNPEAAYSLGYMHEIGLGVKTVTKI